MDQSDIALAALGIVATLAAALIWLLKKLFNQNTVTLKHLSDSSNNLARSIEQLSKVSERQTKIIERQESSDSEWQKYVATRFDELKSIGSRLLTQIVDTQVVTNQTVLNPPEERSNG
jgi:hypothetical protein